MLVYWIALAVSCCLAKWAQAQGKSIARNGLFLLSFLLFSLLAAFRYDEGDYLTYRRAYIYMYSIGEIGGDLLIRILHFITDDPNIFFLATSFALFGFLYKTIKDYSPNWWVSIAVFFLYDFYFIFTNTVLFGMAVSICFFAVRYVIQKRWKSYLLCIAVAILIHRSAAIMIPFYYLCSKKYSLKQYGMGMILFPVCILVLKPAVLHMAGAVYPAYLMSGYNRTSHVELLIMIFSNMALLVALLFLCFWARKQDNGRTFFVFLNYQYVNYCISFFGFYLPQLNRIIQYFFVYWILLLPFLVDLEKNKWGKLLLVAGICLLGYFYLYFRVLRSGDYGAIPYRLVFINT